MDLEEFKKSCGDPEPVYLVSGKDPYAARQVFELCEEQVEPSARSFDWEIYDLSEGRKEDIPALLNSIKTLPWVHSRRWVYVRSSEKAEKELLPLIKDPVSSTVLVLEYTKKPKTWNRIPSVETSGGKGIGWVRSRVQREGFSIDSRAASLLVELVGEEPAKMEGELEKLFNWDPSSRKISPDAVLSVISEIRESEIFDLISALASQNRDKALKIAGRLFAGGTTTHQMIPLLYWNFSRLLVARERLDEGVPFFTLLKELKIWSYRNREQEVRSYTRDFLARILLRIREADRLSKSTSIPPRLHLEKLIVDTQRTGAL